MHITNEAELPQSLVSAITNDPYLRVGDISVSSLSKSPRQFWLERRHDDEIVEDASERIWSLLGQAVHAILERSDTDNHLAEVRMTAEVNGWVLSGQPDLLSPDGVLDDFKVTSVWAVKEAKPEWEQQLNCYAWLYRQHGFEVKRLRIVAILRDWSKRQAQREPDYPQVGVVVREVPLWMNASQNLVIMGLVKRIQEASDLPDDALPNCTPAERWQRPDMWAVKKKGNKRALRVHGTPEAAADYIAEYTGVVAALKRNGYDGLYSKEKLETEFRPGESVKCESYCSVQKWCSQYAKMKG